jgi:hypothetical protein
MERLNWEVRETVDLLEERPVAIFFRSRHASL